MKKTNKQNNQISHGSSVQDNVKWSHGRERWAQPEQSMTSNGTEAYKYSAQYRIIYRLFFLSLFLCYFSVPQRSRPELVPEVSLHASVCKKLHRENTSPRAHVHTPQTHTSGREQTGGGGGGGGHLIQDGRVGAQANNRKQQQQRKLGGGGGAKCATTQNFFK